VKNGSSDRGKAHRGQRRLFAVPLVSATAVDLKAALHDLSVQREELLTKNRQLEEARAALQRSAAYYADLYANAPIPYLTLDLRGVITDLNLTAATFLGRHRERLLGKPFLALVGGGERQVFLGHMRHCRLEGYAKTELQILSGDSLLPVELESRIVPGDTEDATHCRTVVVDLRGRQRVEAARTEAEKERRRSEQREAVTRASSEEKDRFLAELSHELRTPLTPILAAVSSLGERHDLSPALRSAVEMIRRNIETEARLIEDLLDVSRMTRAGLRLQLQNLDAHEILREVVGDLDAQLRAHQVDLHLELNARDCYVLADSLRLRQIVWNLITNAIHNTPAGEHVAVSSSNIGSDLRIVVRDTGVGIAPRDLARIFEPFARVEPAKRQGNGLGLGLSIVKGLVAAHGGRIVALSEGLGHGARFVVELPTTPGPADKPAEAAGAAAPVAKAATRPKPGAGKAKRILIVEDHADTRAALEVLLELKGYDVRLAKDMASALEQSREPVDVLVCDIGLPDGSGLELVRRISARRPVKAIALSGYGSAGDLERSAQAGFAVHLTKPIAADKLLEAIETLCMGDNGA
jgi:PAS domain S-box-containing protein